MSARITVDGEQISFVVAKASHLYGTEGQREAMPDVIWPPALRRERVREPGSVYSEWPHPNHALTTSRSQCGTKGLGRR